MTNKRLLLFTAHYPYLLGHEHVFIEPELPYLLEQFDKITIFPSMKCGNQRPLPEGVSCEPGLATALNKNPRKLPVKHFIRGLFNRLFWDEFVSFIPLSLHPRAIKRSSVWIDEARLVSDWVHKYIKKEQINLEDCLLYTYWLETSASGICLAKKLSPKIKIVSRTLRYDLYEELYTPAFFPLRKKTLKGLDMLVIISNDGCQYLSSKYPQFSNKFKVSVMGVFSSEQINSSSGDGVRRIASCSNLIQVKRVNLILEGLQHLARLHPDQPITWRHFGSGPLMGKLMTLMKDSPRNLSVELQGETPNDAIIDFYANNPIDVFINASSSEGIPVSIMEAQSFGIPVIATDVGGNRESVNNKNGHLLSRDPSDVEIADAIWDVLTSADYGNKRIASFETWQQKFDANKNYSEFARMIRSMLNGSCNKGIDE